MKKYYTGWEKVQRGKLLDFDLESTPLEILTDSEIGSKAKISVLLFAAKNKEAGSITINYPSQKYNLEYCSQSNNTLNDLPSTTKKIWRIALTKEAWTVREVVHCNEVEVVDFLMSDSNCDGMSWRWSGRWKNEVFLIKFPSADTASDYFRPHQGNFLRFTKTRNLLYFY